MTGALIGVSVDLTLQMATNYLEGKSITDIKWGSVAVSAVAGGLSGGIASMSKVQKLGKLAKLTVELSTDASVSIGSQAINDGKVDLVKTSLDVGAGQLQKPLGKLAQQTKNAKKLQTNLNKQNNIANGKSNTTPKTKANVNGAQRKLDNYVNNRAVSAAAASSGVASKVVEKTTETKSTPTTN